MEILLYISAAVAAIAFAVLVIYLNRTLSALRVTLEHLAQTTAGLEKQLKGVTYETEQLLHKTNALAEDMQQKSQSLNKVVRSVEGIGDTIQELNGKLRGITTSVAREAEHNADKVAQVVQWGTAAVELYSKLRRKNKEVIEETVEDKSKKRLPTRARGE
ncbi:DUF948 domain-containing protein [Ectobacillus ponti]|uniref:DUF948 domain-containing protein n=1 Tax=Ectobacillus ponti TaxID=2961894 RepID=A0AA42BN18_9BACI|nr:DUF948 domain-containing protein [Ectobacillus ponti]MCP8967480.1 DUF948 domain-containing protein [Ectobacillus ponti]